MSQLFGPSNRALDDRDNERGCATASVRTPDLPAAPHADEAFFQFALKRSLDPHWRLGRTVAIGCVALAALYLLAQVFVLKTWPTYTANSIVYVQPAPAKVFTSAGDGVRRPYDGGRYETYIEQQMISLSCPDVLIGAVHKLNGFEPRGESDQLATDRLVRMLEVTRPGSAYQFSIAAIAANPAFAAQIANAVTVAYIESAARGEGTGDQLLREDKAPVAAYPVTAAVRPLTRGKSGVLRNTFMIALAGLFFGLLAAVLVHKVDPKIHIAADVERVLGFAPLVQLPNFNEVSEGVAEEYLLRLATAIEHGRKQGNLRTCIFTGTGPGTGVSTLVHRVREELEAMGRTTVLVDATGVRSPAQHSSADPNGADPGSPESPLQRAPGGRVARPTALLERMAEEIKTEKHSLVLTDTAPLSVSAETEYLARFVDCAIVVIESGVTTRDALRETAQTLQRLNIGRVGFVLNRVGLAKADPEFRTSVEAVEAHLRLQGANHSRRKECAGTSGLEEPVGKKPSPGPPPPRSLDEPEMACAEAAVARFSAPPVQKPGSAPAVCLPSSPMGATPAAQAAKRFSLPFSTELAAEFEKPVAVPSIEPCRSAEPALPASSIPGTAEPAMNKTAPDSLPMPADLQPLSQDQPLPGSIVAPPVRVAQDKPFAPLPGAAELLAIAAALYADTPSSSRSVAATVPSNTSIPVQENPSPAVTDLANHSMSATGQKETIEPQSLSRDKLPVLEELPGALKPPVARGQVVEPASNLPWWMSDPLHNAEPVRPPVLWQPAKMRKSEAPLAQPRIGIAPDSQSSAFPGTQKSDSDSAPADRNSRLSGLRNLLFVLGLKNRRSGKEPSEQQASSGPKTDVKDAVRTEQSIAEDSSRTDGEASPRIVPAPPEVLPPGPVVIEFDHADGRRGESSRPDRHPSDDRIATLPSKRGQYKKV
jgi:capsular polysaccharide biosynthesis protein